MKLSWSSVVAAFVAVSVVNAHFEVIFPATRGAFDEDNEPQFCGQCFLDGCCWFEQEIDSSERPGGYTEPANRTRFPLTSGYIVWNASHTQWTSELTYQSPSQLLRRS